MAGAAVLFLAACSRPAASRLGLDAPRPSVVLVTLDTTRADRLGCYGGQVPTPHLDALAAGGVRFARARTAVPLTLPSHTTILTGTYPPRHGSRDNAVPPPPGGPTSIAERFHSAGWATGAFVSAFVLDHRFGLGRGFDRYDDGPFHPSGRVISIGTLERRCDRTVEAALAWAASAPRPLFLWVHFFDPHVPYDAPEPFRSRLPPYEAEIAYEDSCLGTLVAGLRAAGLEPGTLVAAVGDHGEGLGEHGEAAHGVFLYDATLRVPLVIGTLGAAGGAGDDTVVDSSVRTADLAPTLLELAGLPALGPIDGMSLVPLIEDRSDPPRTAYAESYFGRLHFGWAELRALVAGERKYIAAPRPELYDLGRDPGETANLAAGDGAAAASLARDLEALTGAIGDAVAGVPVLDQEAIEKLAALGYVGGAAGAPAPTGADPKDKIGVEEALVAARHHLEEKRWAEGIAALDLLLAREPALLDARFLRGWARLEQGDAGAATRDIGDVLAANPRYPLASLHLGMSLERSGDASGALAAFAAAIALDPGDAEAWWRRADVLAAGGRHPEALADYRRAVALAPEVAALRAKLGGLLLRLGDLAAAGEELRRAAALNPKLGMARFNLALLAERAGRDDEAIAEYRAAIAADPEDVKPLVNLSQLLGKRGAPGDRIEQVRLLREALRLKPDLAPGWDLLAGALAAAGDRAGAARARAHRLD